MSPRFPSSVIDQMLTRGQITRVAPNRAQSDQLLTQAEAHLRSARMLRDTDTAGAFVLAYDAARKALTAVLLNQGLKSRGEGAHALLAEAVGSQLASALDLTGFGWMRTTRQRHRVRQRPAPQRNSSRRRRGSRDGDHHSSTCWAHPGPHVPILTASGNARWLGSQVQPVPAVVGIHWLEWASSTGTPTQPGLPNAPHDSHVKLLSNSARKG